MQQSHQMIAGLQCELLRQSQELESATEAIIGLVAQPWPGLSAVPARPYLTGAIPPTGRNSAIVPDCSKLFEPFNEETLLCCGAAALMVSVWATFTAAATGTRTL
jgi:hypothetical protein